MNEKQQSLVSCIMPTYNRRPFIPHAIRYFLRQDYENKELIIIDDGTDIIADLIPDIQTIRYYRLDKKISLGAKLNLACKYATGKIIANWDDDDWYATRRLKYQVDALENEGIGLCGINNLLYYDLRNEHAYRYVYPSDQRTWLLGSSLCYKKEVWSSNHFADINVGMDGLFVWGISSNRIKVLTDSSISVHMIHDSNVSPKKTDGGWWHTYPVEEIQKIMQTDWAFYSNDNFTAVKKNIDSHVIQEPKVPNQYKHLKNIYACLVHENEDCIIDLVRNLHYHDPASIILLYNGSENPNLIQNHFPFEKFGVVTHPKPIPAKHGYLHPFALECMQFALENFSFDSLTIVDSDQLSIRSGYSEYLKKFLSSQTNIGMLSSNPERVGKDNNINRVAMQAFKEYDLWKPFLNSFPEGDSKFVHWTFWPTTVFTCDAIRDLIKVVKENNLLREIMERSKIWASEEVILPTLVRLLGYEIVTNPCSYDFVKYRKTYTFQDINYAFNKTDAYWIHPIERTYEDPFRKYIRERFNDYSDENKRISCKDNSSEEVFFTSLRGKIKKIEGWLSDQEADLLIAITKKACKDLPSPHNIVEIGSYHGKSTVLFGSVVKKFFHGAKVYAIDPHDGKLGAADQGLKLFPPSFEMFKNNINNEGLSEVVEIIKDNSYNVKWQEPVSLLFIDGLHDYPNVSRDFWHFSNWIGQGGYVAFHDYVNYFPGVQKFVHELLETGIYGEIYKVESLIVLQKL